MTTIPLTRLGRLSLGLLLGTPLPTASQTVHAVMPPPRPPLDDMALLRAIAAVETGTVNLSRPCRKVGKAGERSAWQIKAGTWHRYTRTAFSEASRDATLAHLVAALHLQQLRQHRIAGNMVVTPYWLAVMWNKGPRAHEYATRVAALYEEYTRS